MGHSTDLFDPKGPVASCICTICHDVLENASSFKECGHTFCDGCIVASMESGTTCPNCRVGVTGANPNYVVRDVVDALEVRCPRRGESQSSQCLRNNKRKRGSDDDDVSTCIAESGCTWRGSLKDLKDHENVCDFKVVTCDVDGCNHRCKRKDMVDHLSGAGVLLHMKLMKEGFERKLKRMENSIRADCVNKVKVMAKSILADCDNKLKAMENSIEDKIVIGILHLRYANDCRRWIEQKPDSLIGFSIYPIRSCSPEDVFDDIPKIAGLLCYIPGPKGSVWDGANIPATLRYTNCNRRPHSTDLLWYPPICKFPAKFFHSNVHPSGTICMPLLMDDFHWTSETTLPEILFAIQQFLAHPNFSSPANAMGYNAFRDGGIEGYNRRAKEEANKYSDFVGHHEEVVGMISPDENVDDIEIVAKAETRGVKRMHRELPCTETTSIAKDQTDNENGEMTSI